MRKIFILLTLWFTVFSAFSPQPSFAETRDTKRRVVIVVVDQLRPDYIDHYNLPNLKALREESIDMNNAYVGHFPTITVISHAAIGTGLFPKHFGWINEIWHDDEGVFGEKGAWLDSTAFTHDQYQSIFKKNFSHPTLLSQLKEELGGKVFVVGQKDYAALTFGGMDADRIVTLEKHSDGELKGKCTPVGKNVPRYIAKKDGRFWLDCSNKYGTENELYKLDNRYAPGNDSAHLGGDVWSVDASLEMMKREKDWRVMMVTLAGVDRIGHVYGEMDHPEITPKIKSPYTLEKILHLADDQVGRLVQYLKEQHLWENTVFVVTADHGALSAQNYLGNKKVKDYNLNTKYGHFAFGDFFQVPNTLQPFIKTALIERISADTAIHLWLSEKGLANVQKSCDQLVHIPGTVAMYAKHFANGAYSYERCATLKQLALPSFMKPEEVLNTMANAQAPDLVAQLDEETSYQLPGDHGGLQEKSMRIPLLIHGPDLVPGKNPCPMRLVDILPTVLTTFEIPLKAKTDGNSACVFHQD